jgi:hypothetical protein
MKILSLVISMKILEVINSRNRITVRRTVKRMIMRR